MRMDCKYFFKKESPFLSRNGLSLKSFLSTKALAQFYLKQAHI
jgi:hypothetical protein